MKVRFALSPLTLASVTAWSVLAQGPTHEAELSLTQSLVKRDGAGRTETLVASPQTVMSGDLLQEDLTVTNVSGRELRQVLFSVPLADGARLAARPQGNRQWTVQYSTNGGRSYTALPAQLTAGRRASGTDRPATPSTQNRVRWVVAHPSRLRTRCPPV